MASRIDEARERMINRIMNLDADEDDESEERPEQPKVKQAEPKQSEAHYGNTRLPYGLCKSAGIDTTGMLPHEAWEALESGTGVSHDKAMQQLKETGTVKGISSKIQNENPTLENGQSVFNEEQMSEEERELEDRYWNIPEMKDTRELYNKAESTFKELVNEIMDDKMPFYEKDFSGVVGIDESLCSLFEQFANDVYNRGGTSRGSFLLAKSEKMSAYANAINRLKNFMDTESVLCQDAVKFGKMYENGEDGENITAEGLQQLWNAIDYDMAGPISYQLQQIDGLCPGIEKKIRGDVEGSKIGKDKMDFSAVLKDLYNSAVNFDTLEGYSVELGAPDKIFKTKYAQKHLDKASSALKGLMQYTKELKDTMTTIKSTYMDDSLPEQLKKEKLSEIRQNIWNRFYDVMHGTAKLKADGKEYKAALMDGLEKCAKECNYDVLKEKFKVFEKKTGLDASYKDISEGVYDAYTANEENSIKGGYVKFDDSAFTANRKGDAVWCQSTNESMKEFGEWTSEAFQKASPEQRSSLHNYTVGSGHCNRPLSGYFFDGNPYASTSEKWAQENYKGAGNGDLDVEGGLNDINNITEFLNNNTLQKDTWVQRGVSLAGAMALFGVEEVSAEALTAAMNSGKVFQQRSFISCGAAKNTGFTSCAVTLNLYCPKGVHAGYIAPISLYGGNKDYVGGEFEYNSLENEMVLQRNTYMRISKVTTGPYGELYVDVDIVGQAPVDFNKIE